LIPAASIAAGSRLDRCNLLTSGSMAWLRRVDDASPFRAQCSPSFAHAPSGTAVQADGLSVTPVVSFVAQDGRMCRELHLKDGNWQPALSL